MCPIGTLHQRISWSQNGLSTFKRSSRVLFGDGLATNTQADQDDVSEAETGSGVEQKLRRLSLEALPEAKVPVLMAENSIGSTDMDPRADNGSPGVFAAQHSPDSEHSVNGSSQATQVSSEQEAFNFARRLHSIHGKTQLQQQRSSSTPTSKLDARGNTDLVRPAVKPETSTSLRKPFENRKISTKRPFNSTTLTTHEPTKLGLNPRDVRSGVKSRKLNNSRGDASSTVPITKDTQDTDMAEDEVPIPAPSTLKEKRARELKRQDQLKSWRVRQEREAREQRARSRRRYVPSDGHVIPGNHKGPTSTDPNGGQADESKRQRSVKFNMKHNVIFEMPTENSMDAIMDNGIPASFGEGREGEYMRDLNARADVLMQVAD
ncbi:hypothetical protein BZG36_01689 [Bifiguratus adelaidae]|uniref:Uncharacterized protein n=1 Tax=Bifiguratus adelaidae TaxID=1938954 RepID=A0A261Y4M7_9FUNG|nr:hypothetical protein BZG36_01689 [Bifiguratus adelaidae]